LSEAEASVVSPFTSHTKSPLSVVELLKEGMLSYHSFLIFIVSHSGRASLATSVANYKFLIMYGLIFSVVKLASFYYGVIMSGMSYYCIDGIAITSLSYTMTLSKPVLHLSKKRPTASLLGPVAVASSLGVFLFAFLCLISSLVIMANDPGYVKWPADYSSSGDWWTLSDNWEATVLYEVMYLFLLASAGIFSFGYKFRRNVFENWGLLINIVVLYSITTVIFLIEPNKFTDLWHVRITIPIIFVSYINIFYFLLLLGRFSSV
jgi:magnesium-transporting ATPase (P-type)